LRDFFVQDVILSFFLLALFFAMLGLAQKALTDEAMGFRKGPLLLPVVVGGLMLAVNFIRLFRASPIQAKPIYFILELLINLLVAANEEISFRGLFYVGLREMKNENWALYLGTALFTLMHWGYQPLGGFPMIFISGLILAKLRSRGVSLTVLIVIHWLVDFLSFVYPPYGNTFSIPLFTAMLLIPLGVAFYGGREHKTL
jgi:membrane protease YdiL (CAAX protease family)